MSITLLVMTDGRRCISDTIRSAEANLIGDITRRIIHNDSSDRDHQEWLLDEFPTYETIFHPGRREGFGGAIECAWQEVAESDYVFHLEDDFTFNAPVDLEAMKLVLAATPHLQQLALRRQPWNDQERAAGGIVEMHPEDYTEVGLLGHTWLEHRRHLTTNPSLYRGSLCNRRWPVGRESEGRFSIDLFADDPSATCGYWGARDSGEAVTHIGHERVGCGY